MKPRHTFYRVSIPIIAMLCSITAAGQQRGSVGAAHAQNSERPAGAATTSEPGVSASPHVRSPYQNSDSPRAEGQARSASATSDAFNSPQGAQGIESLRDRVKEHVLPNGMKFLLLERHTSPTVAFHIYFNVGSVDENVGQTGIAHLYEHMAFKGTRQIGTTNFAEESKHFGVIDRIQAELAQERDKGPAADTAKIQRLEAE